VPSGPTVSPGSRPSPSTGKDTNGNSLTWARTHKHASAIAPAAASRTKHAAGRGTGDEGWAAQDRGGESEAAREGDAAPTACCAWSLVLFSLRDKRVIRLSNFGAAIGTGPRAAPVKLRWDDSPNWPRLQTRNLAQGG